MRRKLNKRNAKLFTAVVLVGEKPCGCEERVDFDFQPEQDRDMVEYCSLLYSRLSDFRDRRKRSVDFYYGRQLRDMVKDPDSGNDITEEELLMKRGYPQIVTNIIYKVARTMVSQYSSSVGDPYCVARDRDEQKVGEMLSAALQYVYQRGSLQVKNTNSFLEFVLSALPGWKVGFGWNEETQSNEVYVDEIDDNRIFFDDNTGGLYFEKIQTVGYLHSMNMTDVDDLCDGNEKRYDSSETTIHRTKWLPWQNNSTRAAPAKASTTPSLANAASSKCGTNVTFQPFAIGIQCLVK